MQADVLFLSQTMSDRIKRRNEDAIHSLYASQSDGVFNIYVVEYNRKLDTGDCEKNREELYLAREILFPNSTFALGHYLNIGFAYSTKGTRSPYVILMTAPIKFDKKWFEVLTEAMDEYDFTTACPFTKGYPQHADLEDEIFEGWDKTVFTEHCLVMRRDWLETFPPMNETDDIKSLYRKFSGMGGRHGLVGNSKIELMD